MIEYFKSDIGFLISMFVIFVCGVGIGAGFTDAINEWKGEDNDKDSKRSQNH